jgi:hypothetical protein
VDAPHKAVHDAESVVQIPSVSAYEAGRPRSQGRRYASSAVQNVYTGSVSASLKQVLAVCVSLMSAATPAIADNPRVFLDAAACVASGAYDALDCRRAERNARAEFNEKAPRFAARATCERVFARCMIGDIFAGGGVDFVPTLRGFAILNGPRAGALPVLEGGGLPGLFERRRIDRDEEGVHRGQARNAPGITPRSPGKPAADAELPTSNGGLQAYPVPDAVLRDLRERERKFGGARDDR